MGGDVRIWRTTRRQKDGTTSHRALISRSAWRRDLVVSSSRRPLVDGPDLGAGFPAGRPAGAIDRIDAIDEVERARRLIKQPEHPDRNAGTAADFGVGHGKIAVREVLDLAETLLPPANLEEPFAIDEDVAGGRIGERPADTDLVHEEAFAKRPRIGLWNERRHQVGVVAVDLVGARKVLEVVRPGAEQGEKSGAFHHAEHPDALLSVNLEFCGL